MPLRSTSMRRPRFRLLIGSILYFGSLRDESSATVSSTIGTERYRSALHWRPPQVPCTARPRQVIPAKMPSHIEEVVTHCPAMQQIPIILDKLSAHKTRMVGEFPSEKLSCTVPLHTDILFMAQPCGALVRQDQARRHCPWCLHFCP